MESIPQPQDLTSIRISVLITIHCIVYRQQWNIQKLRNFRFFNKVMSMSPWILLLTITTTVATTAKTTHFIIITFSIRSWKIQVGDSDIIWDIWNFFKMSSFIFKDSLCVAWCNVVHRCTLSLCHLGCETDDHCKNPNINTDII